MQILTTGKNAVYYSECLTEDGSTSTLPIPGSENIVEEVTTDDENYEIWSSENVIMVAYINSYQLNLPAQDTRLA